MVNLEAANAKRELQIPKELELLGNAVNSLQNAISNLQDRLQPIVIEPDSSIESDKKVEEESLVIIAATIITERRRVLKLYNQVNNIIERLEI